MHRDKDRCTLGSYRRRPPYFGNTPIHGHSSCKTSLIKHGAGIEWRLTSLLNFQFQNEAPVLTALLCHHCNVSCQREGRPRVWSLRTLQRGRQLATMTQQQLPGMPSGAGTAARLAASASASMPTWASPLAAGRLSRCSLRSVQLSDNLSEHLPYLVGFRSFRHQTERFQVCTSPSGKPEFCPDASDAWMAAVQTGFIALKDLCSVCR